jgi:hypothetical protein
MGITVSSEAVNLPQNIQDMNGIVLKWICVARWHMEVIGPFFFDDISIRNSFLGMLEN